MNRRLFLILFSILILATTASASEWDNVKANYNPADRSIDIVNAFGAGSTIAHLQLIENTDQALINGRAVFEVTLFEDYVEGVVDGTDFVDILGDAHDMVFKWKVNLPYVKEIPQQVCDTSTFYDENGTAYDDCYTINWTDENGTYHEDFNWSEIYVNRTFSHWIDYNNEDISTGVYEFVLTSKKDKIQSIDFIPHLFGVELPEFAWWSSNWFFRQPLNLSNGGGAVWQNLSTTSITLDTATLVSNGKMRSDCADLEVMFTNDAEATWTQKQRNVEDCNTGSTTVIFNLEDELSVGSESVDEYYIYYGNPADATQEDDDLEDNIYIWKDPLTSDLGGWMETEGEVLCTDIGSNRWWFNDTGFFNSGCQTPSQYGLHVYRNTTYRLRNFMIDVTVEGKYHTTGYHEGIYFMWNETGLPDSGINYKGSSFSSGNGILKTSHIHDQNGTLILPSYERPGYASLTCTENVLRVTVNNTGHLFAFGDCANATYPVATTYMGDEFIGNEGADEPTRRNFGMDNHRGMVGWSDYLIQSNHSYALDGGTLGEENLGVYIEQQTPANLETGEGLNINFSCFMHSNFTGENLTEANILIYAPDDTLDHTETWNWADADGVTSTNVSFLYNLTTTDGDWKWNCDGTDTTPDTTSSENRTYSADSLNPEINYTNLTLPNNTWTANSSVFVEVNWSEVNPDTVMFYLYNGSGTKINEFYNNSLVAPGGLTSYNFTSLADGSYFYNVTLNDTVGHINATELRRVNIDTTAAVISFNIPPTEASGSHVIQTNIYANWSITETNFVNMTAYLYNSTDDLIDSNFSTTAFYEQNWTGLDDGFYIYNINVTDIVNAISGSSLNITLDTTAPVITIARPLVEINNSNIIYNFTVTDTNIAGDCIYTFDGGVNNNSVACTTGVSVQGAHDYGFWGAGTFEVYAEDTAGNFANNSVTFVSIERVSETYDTDALELDDLTFTVTIDDTTNLNPTLILHYNGGTYAGGLISTTGTEKTYTTTFPSPTFGADSVTKYFNWSLTATVNPPVREGTITYPTSNQTLSSVIIVPTTDGTSCQGGTATTYFANYTFLDEQELTDINNVPVTAYYKAWTTNADNYLEFTWEEQHAGINSYRHCMFPDYAQLTTDVKLMYSDNINYSLREFNTQSLVINETIQEFTLYLINDSISTSIIITLVDSFSNRLVDYEVQGLKKNYGNSEVPNEMVDTGITNSEGEVSFMLEEPTITDYYFEVKHAGIVACSSNSPFYSPGHITTSEWEIVCHLDTDSLADIYSEWSDFTLGVITYNNASGDVTVEYSDETGVSSEFCMRLYNLTAGPTSVHDTMCSSSTNALLTVNIGTDPESHFMARTFITMSSDGNTYPYTGSGEYEIRPTTGAWAVIGDAGLFWFGIVLIGTVVAMTLFSPAAAIASSILMLFLFTSVLGVINLGTGVLMWLLVIGGLLIFKIRQ